MLVLVRVLIFEKKKSIGRGENEPRDPLELIQLTAVQEQSARNATRN